MPSQRQAPEVLTVANNFSHEAVAIAVGYVIPAAAMACVLEC